MAAKNHIDFFSRANLEALNWIAEQLRVRSFMRYVKFRKQLPERNRAVHSRSILRLADFACFPHRAKQLISRF